MTSHSITLRQVVVAGVLCSMLAGTVGLSWAEQVIRCPKHAVKAQLKTDLQGATATPGQTFEAELPEDLRYKKWVLPAGTNFKGQITEVGHSKVFNRPGYVQLQVEEATLPNGSKFTFDPNQYKPRDRNLHHPDSLTFGEGIFVQLPYTLAGLAVTIPLRASGATNNNASLFVVGAGVRTLAGVMHGLVRPKYRDEPVARKVALGALDGSGVPRIVGFFNKYPEPDFHAGDTIKLYFNPNGLKDLFQSTASASLKTEGKITNLQNTSTQAAAQN